MNFQKSKTARLPLLYRPSFDLVENFITFCVNVITFCGDYYGQLRVL